MSRGFYILDSRTVVGNCGLWWRVNREGYTCDIDEAGIYPTKPSDRETDIAIPVEEVEKLVVRHVRVDTAEFLELREKYRKQAK